MNRYVTDTANVRFEISSYSQRRTECRNRGVGANYYLDAGVSVAGNEPYPLSSAVCASNVVRKNFREGTNRPDSYRSSASSHLDWNEEKRAEGDRSHCRRGLYHLAWNRKFLLTVVPAGVLGRNLPARTI